MDASQIGMSLARGLLSRQRSLGATDRTRLAHILGVTSSTLTKIIRDEPLDRVKVGGLIAAHLGVSVDWISLKDFGADEVPVNRARKSR
jgi:DNA-binding XRE family transcriptional regulator